MPVLRIFRTNQIFSSIFLVFYILLLRFSVFVADFTWSPSGEGLLSNRLYGWVGSQAFWAQVLAILLLVVQGFLVNSIVIRNRLANETNLFPGVFYVLVSCMLPDFLYLSPVLIGNTFVLIALAELFSVYKKPSCADRIFNVGFWTGVAGLFYFPFLFYIVFIIAGLNILRAFKVQERLMAVTGLLMPFFLAGLYFFAFDRFDFFWETQFVNNFSFFSLGGGGVNVYAKGILFTVLIAYVALASRSYFAKRNIQAQKKISILYWVMASVLVGAVFQKNLAFEHLLMLAPPLGVFLAFSFSEMKSQWSESIHFLLVLGVLALQFVPWLL